MRKLLLFLGVVLLMAACSTADCSMSSDVRLNFKIEGPTDTLPDTLSIATTSYDDNDTVLINSQVNSTKFWVHPSFARPIDTLYFHTNHLNDTVYIEKTNEPYFESVDCGLAYYHTLQGVQFTRHALDSVVINFNRVTYDTVPNHIYLYFKEYRN